MKALNRTELESEHEASQTSGKKPLGGGQPHLLFQNLPECEGLRPPDGQLLKGSRAGTPEWQNQRRDWVPAGLANRHLPPGSSPETRAHQVI